ncbi:hypothetical protein C8R43DRAFT_1143389 [Mycena crocata]|nr:hypothetical protein C8R43DRAFT_1143389 [Mycena crocata]
MRPPPLTSKPSSGPTENEIKEQRLQARREHSRLKRAELKAKPLEEQAHVAAQARVHQATYREKNHADLRVWEAQRRREVYKARYGTEAYTQYIHLRWERKRRAREKR